MRTRYTAIVVGLYVLLLGGSLIAQAPLTESEKKDIEILTLKAQLASATKRIGELQVEVGACQAVLAPAQFEQQRESLTAEQRALKDAIEKARPGFEWNPQTGAFTKKAPDPKTGKR